MTSKKSSSTGNSNGSPISRSKRPTLLIVGGSSFLGRYLLSYFSELGWRVFRTERRAVSDETVIELDLEKGPSNGFADWLSKETIQVAIFCAAITDVQVCEKQPEYSRFINVIHTREVLELFKKNQIFPVFFSSDYVFSGTLDRPTETVSLCPVTVYGKQKREVEDFVQSDFSKYLIYRTGRLLSLDTHPRNSLFDLFKKLKAGVTLRLPADRRIAPVFIEDIAQVIQSMIDREFSGLFHLAAEKDYSWVEIAQCLLTSFDMSGDLIQTYLLAEQNPLLVSSPRFSTLNSKKAREAIDFKFMEVPQGILKFKDHLELEKICNLSI